MADQETTETNAMESLSEDDKISMILARTRVERPVEPQLSGSTRRAAVLLMSGAVFLIVLVAVWYGYHHIGALVLRDQG